MASPASLSPITLSTGDDKQSIREKVWEYLEKTNIAEFPRPVHKRIPNFKGAGAACERLTSMDIFKKAQVIKVNPDKPQQQARLRTMEAGKTLLVPTPRIATGLFNKITPPPQGGKAALKVCATSQGVKEHSVPVGLDAKVKVDLIVIGSVAVSPSGLRIGKGEGYADLEYGMMVSMGAVDDQTTVVSIVHDCQVLDLPEDLAGPQDLPVNVILTPTTVIHCPPRPRPPGIIWSILTAKKLQLIPVLKQLRHKERLAGKDVALSGDSDDD